MSLISFQAVSKSYPIYSRPADRLRELLTFQRRQFHRDFWALRDISFDIEAGETFCIIGENGSGKSTLLQLVAGIFAPTLGTVSVRGRVSALLELGSGFNPEFTGKENVYLNASILGFSSGQIDRIYQQIEEFAEIGEFIHQPVKTYSSGMVVRLAFAVAIHVDPDILIVDEALAVGDVYFRQRCLRKVHELRSRGVTILFVSHSTGDVKAIGDRCLWLDQGQIRALDKADRVVTQYLAAMAEKDTVYLKHQTVPLAMGAALEANSGEVAIGIPNIDHRFGDGRAEIVGIAVLNPFGEKQAILQPNSEIVVRVTARANAPLARPNIGVLVRNHLGVDFFGANTTREGVQLAPMRAGETRTVDFHIDLPQLYPSAFSFSPAIADGELHSYQICDWIDNAIALQMDRGDGEIYGFVRLPCRVQIHSPQTQAPSNLEAPFA